jgi:osmotically-inducible protein OsmY
MHDLETTRTIAAGNLLADPILRRYDLQVRAIAPGILDLSGMIDSDEEAERALQLVRRAPGVRTVLNRIDVVPTAEELKG